MGIIPLNFTNVNMVKGSCTLAMFVDENAHSILCENIGDIMLRHSLLAKADMGGIITFLDL